MRTYSITLILCQSLAELGCGGKNRYFSTNNVPDPKKRKRTISEDFIEKIISARDLSTKKTKMLSFANVLKAIGKNLINFTR